jgi:hypothetical protein
MSATDGWFLDYVEISCIELKKTWMFFCNKWLSKHRPPNYKRVSVLYPGDGLQSINKPLKTPKIDGCGNYYKKKKRFYISIYKFQDYFIIIKTDNRMLSGTDANVTFQLKGSLGLTETFPLVTKNVDLFEKNQIDIFIFESHVDIGEPIKIK